MVRAGFIGVVAAALLSASAGAGAGATDIETRYVGQLRATVAEVKAASAEVSALRRVSGGTVWARGAAEVNPFGGVVPDGESIMASDGHTDRDITVAPMVEFDADWTPPPTALIPGATLSIPVTVAGRLTGGTDVQGFRPFDAIFFLNDSWFGRAAVGTGQSCVDPIGALPISCTDPSSASGAFTLTVPSSATGTFSVGVGALNCSACYVRYTYRARSKRETLKAAGTRLIAAVGRAKAILVVYRRAAYRHGTSEEHRLVAEMLGALRITGPQYGRLVGSPVRTTPAKAGPAKKLVRAVAAGAASAAVERWPGIDSVAAVLRNPRRADKVVAKQITRRLAGEVRRHSARIARRAVSEKLPLQLGTPLRAQVRSAAERWALERLARAVLKLDKRGIVLEFLGQQVRIVLADVALAARSTTKVERRTDITVSGYTRHEARLTKALADPDGRLGPAQDAVDGATGAIRAARLLRADLDRLVRRRCVALTSARCTGAQKTRARLLAADRSLARVVRQTKVTFLLGQEFDPAKLRSWIAGLSRMQADLKRARSRA